MADEGQAARFGLRLRLTALATVGLAIGLAIGAFVFIGLLDYTLRRTVDTAASKTADDVAMLIGAGNIPDPIPVSGPGAIVQVVQADGRVRAGSSSADRLVSILRPETLDDARAGKKFTVSGDRVGDSGRWRVVAVGAGLANDPLTVVVAVPAAESLDSVRVVRRTLLLAFPLVIAASGVGTWLLVGRALRPVEALRRGAAEITDSERDARLPVPRSRDEVHRLAVTLNAMLERIAATGRRQREFVADVAHELRSPLASLRTQLEVAQRTGDHEVAADALLEAERLSSIVDDLLLLARADEGKLGAHRMPVDVLSCAREIAPKTSLRDGIHIYVDEGRLYALADPGHLRRILTNLIENAARHAESQVHVSATQARAGWIDIVVGDDGPGIPMGQWRRVFERFTRLDDARARDVGGSGLGLPIVAELVAVAGGRVSLADARPHGLRVVVRLPTARDTDGQVSAS